MIPLGGMLEAEVRRETVVVGRRAKRPEGRVGGRGRGRSEERREPVSSREERIRVQLKTFIV